MAYNKTPRLCKILLLNAKERNLNCSPLGIDFTDQYLQSLVDKTRESRDLRGRSGSSETYSKIFKLRHKLLKKEP